MLSSLLALSPIATLVALLSIFKRPAWQAALGAFVVGAALALVGGVGLADLAVASLEGVKTGLYPIGLVIIGALFVYGVTVESGEFKAIKEGLASCAPEPGLAALLIVWGFGNFMEGMAGFGTAVAIPVAILVGIGFDPFKAVLACLVINTTPTAFGSVGVPTMILAQEAGVALEALTWEIAVLQIVVTALGPFLILFIVGGREELRRHAREALVSAVAFIVPQLLVARVAGCELPDIVGGLAVMMSLGAWKLARQARAWAPFVAVIVILCGASLLPREVKPSPGVLLIGAGLIGAAIQRVKLTRAVRLVGETAWTYRLALLTVCVILALAKTMAAAGMIRDLADALVTLTGFAYPFFSPVVGALGGFVTGSGTSTCVLFGKLQSAVGSETGHSLLYAAANVMGAGIGKMICPQSIVLGCAAAGLAGRESEMLARSARFFVPVLVIAGLVTFVASCLP